ncbi:hypothetical protein J6590_010853 [Homalodisca vitripennis]|nr:hypothetical protein J6590_010853 [Homalodisca vitripennis]
MRIWESVNCTENDVVHGVTMEREFPFETVMAEHCDSSSQPSHPYPSMVPREWGGSGCQISLSSPHCDIQRTLSFLFSNEPNFDLAHHDSECNVSLRNADLSTYASASVALPYALSCRKLRHNWGNWTLFRWITANERCIAMSPTDINVENAKNEESTRGQPFKMVPEVYGVALPRVVGVPSGAPSDPISRSPRPGLVVSTASLSPNMEHQPRDTALSL